MYAPSLPGYFSKSTALDLLKIIPIDRYAVNYYAMGYTLQVGTPGSFIVSTIFLGGGFKWAMKKGLLVV